MISPCLDFPLLCNVKYFRRENIIYDYKIVKSVHSTYICIHVYTHARAKTLLLLRSNPSRCHSKVLYRGSQEKRKDKKTWKIWSEQKGVGFSSVSLFPGKKPFNQGDRPPDAEENPGSWYRQRLGG